MQGDHSGEPFASEGESSLQVDWVRAYSLPASVPIPGVPPVPVENPGFESDDPGDQEAVGWGEWSPVNANSAGFIIAGGHSGNAYRMEGANYSRLLSQVVQVPEPGLILFAHGRAARRATALCLSSIIREEIREAKRLPRQTNGSKLRYRTSMLKDPRSGIGLWFEADDWAWVEWDDVELMKQGSDVGLIPAELEGCATISEIRDATVQLNILRRCERY